VVDWVVTLGFRRDGALGSLLLWQLWMGGDFRCGVGVPVRAGGVPGPSPGTQRGAGSSWSLSALRARALCPLASPPPRAVASPAASAAAAACCRVWGRGRWPDAAGHCP